MAALSPQPTQPPRARPTRRRDLATGCALALILLVVPLPVLAPVYYLTLSFAVQTVHVIGSAMEPAVRSGDYLVADKVTYRLRGPARGDIVVFRDPSDPRRDLIKRVVGLPGERLLVSNCAVSVDGRRLAEPYVRGWSVCDPRWPVGGRPAPLASDEFFVMGDNRDHSLDSRELGPIGRNLIEALVRFRVLGPGT